MVTMTTYTQGTSAPASPAQPVAPPAPQSGTEVKRAIQQSIQDAFDASRDAQAAARDARARARDAQQGTTAPPPGFGAFDQSNVMPPQVLDISIAFFIMCAVIIIGWPLSRAFGKRLERRAETATVNPAMTDQLQRIEQAVEAMSIEIERISESQRFMAKLQNATLPDRGSLPAHRA
jgi:hypothetical protein